MFKRICCCRGLIAGLVSLTLLAAACDSDDSGSPADEDAAGADRDSMARERAKYTTDSDETARLSSQRAIVSERLPYAEVDDRLVYGHFAFPSNMIEPLPAVIMIHERWGLNDNIRAMADRLAAEGYIVLAIDLFGGQVAERPEAARQLMLSVIESPESATANIRQAYDFVSSTAGAPRVASMGLGFGGGWSLNMATEFPDELDAAVIYYGQVTADEDELRPINAHILGLFGADDRVVSAESAQAFAAALERLRKDHEIHIYPGVASAFANPTDRSYDVGAADDAWNRTLEFLGQRLSSDES